MQNTYKVVFQKLPGDVYIMSFNEDGDIEDYVFEAADIDVYREIDCYNVVVVETTEVKRTVGDYL